jgi:hypothetical protein
MQDPKHKSFTKWRKKKWKQQRLRYEGYLTHVSLEK